MLPLKSDLDADVHTGRKVELLQLVNRLSCGVDNIENPLVSAYLELLHGFLVHKRRLLTVNRSMRVGSGMGPAICAPVRFTVLTISVVD